MLASQLAATTRPPDRVALKRVATVDEPLVLDATPDAIAAAVAAIEAKQMAAALNARLL